MTKPVAREERLQRAVVQHLMMCLPPNVVWYAVPNGGHRSKSQGARLKAQGVRAGVADLAFVLPSLGKAAFIELKVEKNYEGPRTYLDKPQKAFRDDVHIAGGLFACCRSLDEVLDVLGSWGVPIRYRATNQRPTIRKVA